VKTFFDGSAVDMAAQAVGSDRIVSISVLNSSGTANQEVAELGPTNDACRVMYYDVTPATTPGGNYFTVALDAASGLNGFALTVTAINPLVVSPDATWIEA